VRFIDEYRDPSIVRGIADAMASAVTRPWTVMEICGGQTHAIVKFGLDELLPPGVALVHGPGCPVCVTPAEMIDQAAELSLRPGVTLCSFGDMLRVPGTGVDLLTARARGGAVKMVYSPLDAVRLAQANPRREFVFFAVGFETTAPANAMAVLRAERDGLANFSMVVSHVLVPPAMRAILSAGDNLVRGFLAAGHVCAVMGTRDYEPIAREFGAPIVVTGFEPVDILEGLLRCLRQLEEGRGEVENAYARVVRPGGNPVAKAMVDEVFEVVDRNWRGLGPIPESGLSLKERFARFDAVRKFGLGARAHAPAGECISGRILRGLDKPAQCPAFGTRCTPDHPLGAPMVSSEGACAAYHRYRPVRIVKAAHREGSPCPRI
jgi:hydrogenase expression/formation protein HypD